MLKILYLIDSAGIGGAEKALLNELKFIDKTKFETHLICLKGGSLFELFLNHAYKVNIYSIEEKDKISAYIKQNSIDVIHLFNTFELLRYVCDTFPEIKKIQTIHMGAETLISREALYLAPKTKEYIHHFYVKTGSIPKNIGEIKIKNNERFFPDFLVEYRVVSKDCLKVIPVSKLIKNYIDCNVFKPKKRGREKNTIVWQGKDTWEKGIDLLLETIKKSKDKKFNLIFASKLSEKTKKELENYTNVKIYECLKEKAIISILNKSEIVFIPSRYEAQSIFLLESMACGCIPIVRNVGGLKEIIKDSGFITDADKDQNQKFVDLTCSFIDKISKMKKKDKTRLQNNGRKHIIENYDLKKGIKIIEGMY